MLSRAVQSRLVSRAVQNRPVSRGVQSRPEHFLDVIEFIHLEDLLSQHFGPFILLCLMREERAKPP